VATAEMMDLELCQVSSVLCSTAADASSQRKLALARLWGRPLHGQHEPVVESVSRYEHGGAKRKDIAAPLSVLRQPLSQFLR